MAIITARNTFIGLGGESTYGVDGTVDRWFMCESVTLEEKQSIVDAPSMFQATGSSNVQFNALGPSTCEGTMVLLPTYTGFGTVLQSALGSLSTTGAGPYVHVYKLTAADAVSLTGEVPTGDSGSADTMGGFVVSVWEFSVEAGTATYAKFMLKGIAQKRLSRATTSTATITGSGAPGNVIYHQSGNLAFNAANYIPKSFKIGADHGYARVDILGSKYTAQPVKDKFTICTASMVLEFTAAQYAALRTAQLAGTQGDLTYTFTSGANSMLFTLHNAIITDMGVPISGAGRLSATVAWKGYSDGTDEGVSVTVTNAQSSGLAV